MVKQSRDCGLNIILCAFMKNFYWMYQFIWIPLVYALFEYHYKALEMLSLYFYSWAWHRSPEIEYIGRLARVFWLVQCTFEIVGRLILFDGPVLMAL